MLQWPSRLARFSCRCLDWQAQQLIRNSETKAYIPKVVPRVVDGGWFAEMLKAAVRSILNRVVTRRTLQRFIDLQRLLVRLFEGSRKTEAEGISLLRQR